MKLSVMLGSLEFGSMKSELLAKKIANLVSTYSVEIGLQTCFRKPHEMVETPQWWKLQKAENLIRELNHKVQSLSDELIKELQK